MKKVIAAKRSNNPQRQLESFRFTAYNKLMVTANPDSIPQTIDSITRSPWGWKRKNVKADSTLYKFRKIAERQHLFLTEKVSSCEFDGQSLKETILGMKMSGFTRPIYEILGFDLQSFSLYGRQYELLESRYKSPIADDASRNYHYWRRTDSIIDNRPVFRIGFADKTKSAGLNGELSFDMETYALASVRVETKGVLNIGGRHELSYQPHLGLWFPSRSNFKVTKGDNDEDIDLLVGTITFDGADPLRVSRSKDPSDFTYLTSETTYSQVSYNVPVKLSHPAIAIEVREEAAGKPEEYWRQFRKDTVDIRQEVTYKTLDSLIASEKIESKLRFGRKIINGYVPFGPIDFDLRNLLSFNNFEGFRLGVGGVTNERLSEKFRIEGYTAFGTKDGDFKYHLGSAVRFGRFSSSWIGGSYTDDVREIASTTFAIDKRVFKVYDPRPFNISTFYNHVTWRGFIETKIIPKTESIWQVMHSTIEPKFGYAYELGGKVYDHFTMTTAQASLQWNPYSDYMQTPVGRTEVEKRFPKFTFQITKSIPDVLDNDFDFTKFDFRAEYEKRHLNGQKSSALIEAGLALGQLPLTHLYNTAPNNLTNDRILQRLTFAGKNSFETMYFNEFFSSRFVMLQAKHALRRVTLTRQIKPSVVFVTRAAWGAMDKPQRHVGLPFKTLEAGFYESGVELNQIYKFVGLGGFYRYGPNQLSDFEDNIAIKISFVLNLF